MNAKALLLTGMLALASSVQAASPVVTSLQDQYRSQGASEFSASRGEQLWQKKVADSKGGERACTACHGQDIRQNGQHASTKKLIKPMAASANPKRYTDDKKVSKWLTRNCKWTWGRDCTPQEKGDLLEYLITQ